MEENVNLQEEKQQPDCDEAILQSNADTTNDGEGQTKNTGQETLIELKFNKETKRIPLSEAKVLAQKGMKLDSIAPIFEKLKGLSKEADMSVEGYISHLQAQGHRAELLKECGGNEKMVDRILNLEESSKMGEELREIKTEFPEINSLDDLPEEVKTAAKNKGTGLLFEHLLFQHHLRRAAEEELSRKKQRESQTLGSLSVNTPTSTADAEFLKGLWGK